MKVTATEVQGVPGLIAGAWKFKRTDGAEPFGVSIGELAQTAKDLVNLNPGQGTFFQMHIRSTAKHELGICFMYAPGPTEKPSVDDDKWTDPYRDFFYRRHGIAYKGYDIGYTVIEIVLDNR